MTSQGYARPEMLADTDWLADHIDDPNLRVIDCDDFSDYRRAHIKNAAGIQVHHYIKHPNYSTQPQDYPWVAEPDVMKELMERMGIGDDALVVTYDASGSLNAARFWWVLNYYGHTNVKVLNGGWRKWFDEGKPMSMGRPPDASVTFTPQANPDLICTLDHGVSAIDDENTLFLDVRTDGEWEGTNDRGNRRAGRVPGSVHLEWVNFLTEDSHRSFKPAAELKALLEGVGATPDKNVIAY